MDVLGLCGEKKHVDFGLPEKESPTIIPTIPKFNYQENGWDFLKVVLNSVINIPNGFVELGNFEVSNAYYMLKYGPHVMLAEYWEFSINKVIDFSEYAVEYVKTEWEYRTTTPYFQQLIDHYSKAFQPEYIERDLTIIFSIGIGAVIGKVETAVGKNWGGATRGLTPYAKGQQGVANAIESFRAKGGVIRGTGVSLKINMVRIKADAVGVLNEKYYIIEAKQGLGAAFTKNQGLGYPNMNSGIIPIGENAANARLQVGQTYFDFGFFLHWGE